MTITDAQMRIIMRERRAGKTQEQAAAKANAGSRKTVRKYEKLGKLPSELKQPRVYRTHADAFAEDWPEVEAMLEQAPGLEAKALFEWLSERHPGRYQAGQLRTFQRRVSGWKALHQEKLLTLEQVHEPGEVLQTDGMWMTKLGVTIQGEAFPHMVLHSVLPYSNWEWGRVVQSESLMAIRLGLQSALSRLGHVPKVHQTDNTTAATHKLSAAAREQSPQERGFNEEYLQLLAHLGMTPRTIHIGRPDENGDVESANGAFKRAVEQHLLLRGSRDFESVEAYEQFLWEIMTKRNQLRQKRLAEELAVMPALTAAPWPAMQELRVRVGRTGLIRVQANRYSVPSGLKGKWVTVRLYEWQMEIWYANQLVERLPRLTGNNKHQVNYRHVIGSLLRKPGGFRNYRYRESLFPRLVFHQAWEALNRRYSPRRADIAYLHILNLAAKGMEGDVAAVLAELLTWTEPWDDGTVAARVQASPVLPQMQQERVDLSAYDRLLQEVCHDAA